LTSQEGIEIVDAPPGERAALEQILQESFQGWYLRHSKGILRDVEIVRAAVASGAPVGLIMLKMLEPGVGYVYYVAVARSHRRKGVARLLLDDALRRFKVAGAAEVFASVEDDNAPSERLFAAEGFTRTSFAEVSKGHGALHALNMYRMMVVVPGEVLLHKTME
jgi:ribosomal protein S18 acetylase RimI-like enzyme